MPGDPVELLNLVDAGWLKLNASADMRALISAEGALLGHLFDRGQRCAADTLSPGDWAAIAASKGEALMQRYWGSYVAFVRHHEQVSIIRPPFADLGCFYHETPDVVYVSSDVSLLMRAAHLTRSIASEPLARHLAWPDWRFEATCLQRVRELRGGDRLTIFDGEVRLDTIWTPWPQVCPAGQLQDRAEAVQALRDAVRAAVAAHATEAHRALLLLSGGFDSSVVAACLRDADVDFACLNLVADDAASDERDYARLAAGTVGRELNVEHLTPDLVDIGRSGAAGLPYPVHRAFTQAQDGIAQQVAERMGADVVIDGGGGDNVFFASRSVSILADCLIANGFDRRFWSAAGALGDLAQTGLVRLVTQAACRAWWRPRAPRGAANLTFLEPEVRAAMIKLSPHPWYCPPAEVLPGRAAHVALLAPAQNMVEAVNAGAPYRAISPLASQPVVEACLRIPSWFWLEPGRDRAAARRAFATDLPADLVGRRSKGTPTGFVARIFEQSRPAIRDLLLGGWLAEHRLIDTAAVSHALSRGGPVLDLGFAPLMSLIDAEAWARAQH